MDLQNPTGQIAILVGFVIIFVFIAIGAAFAKVVAREERRKRQALREQIEAERHP